MKTTFVLALTALALAAASFPLPASAHYASCANGMSGAGSVWCAWSCTANHNIWVQTSTNNGAYVYVDGRTQCGNSGTASCAANGVCSDSDYTSSHQDGAGCFGSSTNSGGFSTQCWEPGGSSTNWPLPTCLTLECTQAQVAELAARVPAVLPQTGAPSGVVIYSFADHAVGYACSDDLSVCSVIVPACTLGLDGVKTCRL